MSFAGEVAGLLPDALELPGEIRAAMDWLEGQGHRDGDHLPTSLADDPPRSETGFLREAPHGMWLHPPARPALLARLHQIAVTGGDGSRAALWRGDDGVQRLVHLGSGSGSVWAGVVTDDPVDFLRFLATGHGELCWPDSLDLTPEQAFLTDEGFETMEEWAAERDEQAPEHRSDPPPEPPRAFQAWIEATFGRPPIRTPAEVARPPHPGYGADPQGDPFAAWMNRLAEETGA